MDRNRFMKPFTYGIIALVLVGAALAMLKPKVRDIEAAAAEAPPMTIKPSANAETATFAAGCFWSMQAIFQQLKGVEQAMPGYSGGTVANPTYEQVESGETGHAETIDITFDPSVISYSDLLQVLLTCRNPTTLNSQGNDSGTNYRSAIFYRNEAQHQAALAAIRKITAEHIWKDPIVTTVEPYKNFYKAEDYHYNYYNLHPNEGYCKYVIAPEIADFQAKFKSKLKPGS